MKGIFLIKMDDTPPLDNFDAAPPRISLNAIINISSIETMKL
jgi:hypothetical protein